MWNQEGLLRFTPFAALRQKDKFSEVDKFSTLKVPFRLLAPHLDQLSPSCGNIDGRHLSTYIDFPLPSNEETSLSSYGDQGIGNVRVVIMLI